MTTALPARVAALREKLARLESLSSKAAEASELSGLRGDLRQPVHDLTALVERHVLFQTQGVPITTPESLMNLRRRAVSLRDKFRIDRTSRTLKKGTAWKAMLDEVTAASSDVEKSISAAWRDYRSTLFAGETPNKIRGSLAQTPGNNAALEAYRATYEAFTRLFQTPPSDPSVVERAQGLALELMRIAERFDYNVDPEVKVFLEAVQAGGAPLSLLTPAVLAWMQAGDGMDSYRIHAAEAQ